MCCNKNITDSSLNKNNSIFSTDDTIRYYMNQGFVNCFNKHFNHRISKSGIYIMSKSKVPYDNIIESEGEVYECEEGHCELVNELDSQFYLNMANMNDEKPVILYYRKNTKTWSRIKKDEYCFFNEKG